MLSAIRHAAARVVAQFRGPVLDRDLNDELESHFDMLVEDAVRRGMTREEAERSAKLSLGGRAQLRETHREVRGMPLLDGLVQDLRYAVRTLRRDAGFTTFAVLIVGLGIGASATVFSVLNAVLLRPLPFSDSGRLAWISNDGNEGDLSGQTVPVNPFVDLRKQSQSLSDVAAYFAFYKTGDQKMTGEGEPERLTAVPVSDGFFPLLGIRPQIGRLFTAEECRENRAVVVLSAGFWKRRFASDRSIVGRAINLNERLSTVIGVMPESFDFGSVFAPGSRIDLFLPLPLTAAVNRQGNTLSLIGRLKPGVSVEQAQAELNVLSEPIRIRNNRSELRFKISLLEEHVSGRVRTALLVLAAAIGVVMLIVCANLSNLQLARAATRQKEMAIRVSLGAGRGRLVRQMLTESLLLSCCAAALGAILAMAGARVLSNLNGIALPLRESIRFDTGTVAFTVGIAIVTGVLFGLVPAFQVPGAAVHDGLKETNRGASEGKRHQWVRSVLVISEIAFACVLLVGAGLLVRSFLRVLDVDLGFRPESASTLRIDPSAQYSNRTKRNAYFDEALRLARDIPGVEAAGLTDALPLGSNRSWSAGAKGQTYSESHPPPDVFVRIVSDGYLRAMGIQLRAGRDLAATDTASSKPVMLVNETLARILWPGQNAVGQTATYVDRDREVVGIVADVRHVTLEQGSGSEMYLPIRQTDDYSSVDLVVRSSLPPAALSNVLRTALQPIDPNLPAKELRPIQQLIEKSTSPRRFVVVLLTGFSAFALLLACLGIYGVISYWVHRRTQEIGIRMALGASAADLQWRIIFQTLGLTAIGIAAGVTASLFLTSALGSLLFGITATDPLTFAGMLVLLTGVAIAAGYFPARRASRIDPMAALRAN